MEDNKKIILLILIVVFVLVNLLIFKEKFLNKENFQNDRENDNKNDKQIDEDMKMSLFDDSVVRIKVHKLSYNWIEPYNQRESVESIGSGFFINAEGFILTNYHVIQDNIKVFIQLPKYGADTYECSVLSVHPRLDIALLKVNIAELLKKNINFTYLVLGDSEQIKKGQEVVAVGYPLGQNKTKITKGVISGFQDGDIQTDTAINPGNSGGPLVYDGKVVGINYAGFDKAQNVGYAIPIEYIKINFNLLNTKSIVNYPIIGATFNNSNEMTLKVGSNCKEGYYVSKVLKGSSFDLAGLKEGDIVCKFDNLPLDNYGELFLKNINTKFHISDYMKYKKVGDVIPVEYSRKRDSDSKIILQKKNVKLLDNSFYKIRTLYPKYNKVEYQNIGGLVIMPLCNNHLIHKKFENQKSLQKYKTIEEKSQGKLIITNIIKGSKISENEIIKAPSILKKVNDLEVNNMSDLRRALYMYQKKNDIKYISFLTENDKYVVMDLDKVRNEELFLSKKFNYPINEFTRKLLNLPIEQVVQVNQDNNPQNILIENNNFKLNVNRENNKNNKNNLENIKLPTNTNEVSLNNNENFKNNDLKKDIYTLMSSDDAPGISPGISSNISSDDAPSISPGISLNNAPGISLGISLNNAPSISPGISLNNAPGMSPGISLNNAPGISPGFSPSISSNNVLEIEENEPMYSELLTDSIPAPSDF